MGKKSRLLNTGLDEEGRIKQALEAEAKKEREEHERNIKVAKALIAKTVLGQR